MLGIRILTTLHVMDELIKHKRIDSTENQNYSGAELPREITSVRLYDALDAHWMLRPPGEAGPMLVLTNARTGDDEPFSWRDNAAFSVRPSRTLTPIQLSAVEPKPGDALWLAARMSEDSRTCRAVCVQVTPQSLVFRYDEMKTPTPQPSGAAILDRAGAVVAVNSGRGRFEGEEFGHAIPLTSIRTHLTPARATAMSMTR